MTALSAHRKVWRSKKRKMKKIGRERERQEGDRGGCQTWLVWEETVNGCGSAGGTPCWQWASCNCGNELNTVWIKKTNKKKPPNVWSVTLATVERRERQDDERPGGTKRVRCLLNLQIYIQPHIELTNPLKAIVCKTYCSGTDGACFDCVYVI